MPDNHISVTFSLLHLPADADTIEVAIRNLRWMAGVLGFQLVGDVVRLNGKIEIIEHDYGDRFLLPDLTAPVIPTAVIFFEASLPDSDVAEFGLESYASKIEGRDVPTELPVWTWTGLVRTREVKCLSYLLEFAAALGIEATLTHDGMFLTFRKDGTGKVKCEQDSSTGPEDS